MSMIFREDSSYECVFGVWDPFGARVELGGFLLVAAVEATYGA